MKVERANFNSLTSSMSKKQITEEIAKFKEYLNQIKIKMD